MSLLSVTYENYFCLCFLHLELFIRYIEHKQV